MPEAPEMPDELTLADGRTVLLAEVAHGRVLTRRLTAPEIAADMLDADVDLFPGTAVADLGYSEMVLAVAGDDDDEFERRDADPADFHGLAIALPIGALRDRAAGDLVGVEIRDGECRLVSVEAGAAPAELAARVDALVGDSALPVHTLMLELLAADASMFAAPVPPLSELLAENGFEIRDALVARAGFDFDDFLLQMAVGLIADTFDLYEEEAQAVQAFRLLVLMAGESDSAPGALEDLALGALASPAAAEAAWELSQDDDPAAIRRVALLLAHGPRRARPAGYWLAGRAADRMEVVDEAENHYEDALSADAGYVPALLDLAFLAADRSDIVRCQSLFDRAFEDAGENAQDLLTAVAALAPAPHPELGRNDRCWCGSGRKYKVCHLGKSEATDAQRAEFLYQRAEVFAVQYARLADALAAFPVDAALFEGGALDEYRARRVGLLTDEDRRLLEAWSEVPRSLYEVVEADSAGATLRDVRTEETVRVVGDDLDRARGDVITTRALPVGEQVHVFDWYSVADFEAADVLECLDEDDDLGLLEVLGEIYRES